MQISVQPHHLLAYPGLGPKWGEYYTNVRSMYSVAYLYISRPANQFVKTSTAWCDPSTEGFFPDHQLQTHARKIELASHNKLGWVDAECGRIGEISGREARQDA